ncbi:MAG TPA: Spy/CpxP family protein refolding chaperone [Bryobacteraceae bacterium]|nr:Spy/CpxP family protein refolding chaperone [Bryobacteraceae bacterium]
MKTYLTRFATVAALAAGMAFAQTTPAPATAPQTGTGKAAVRPRAAMRRRMMQALNLTPDQKQQAQAIFQQTRQSVQPIAQQAKQNRQALADAVKANDTAKIQQLASQQGSLNGQLLTLRSESMAKFYNILTPDQRAKADQMQMKIQQLRQQRRAAFQG